MKAIGAKSQTILTMFLTEAAIIGVMGGFIGMFAGYGLSYVLVMALKFHAAATTAGHLVFDALERPLPISPIFTPKWKVAAFVFAIVVCLVFGLYPARKAAKLDPVKALGYE